MHHNPYRHARFLKGAHELRQLPADRGREAAFAGRSNSGKSMVINAVTESRNLARVSRTPGRTRQINFFKIDADVRLVDLPGYGYARVEADLRQHWAGFLDAYFHSRASLKGVVIIMDIRRPFMEADCDMLALARAAGCPAHIVLNKADKLSRATARRALEEACRNAREFETGVQLFSARSGAGAGDLRDRLAGWLYPA